MIRKACLVGNSLRNTGKECDISMVAPAMFIAVPPNLTFTLEEISDDIIAWITPLLHSSKATRVYPFFGNKAPINTVSNNAESDVTVTLDDGTIVFLRYGIYNRTFETISGGLCYAKSLQGLNKSGYNFLEIDQQGQLLMGKTGQKTNLGLNIFRGLISSFMYSPSPILPDFKGTPYKNRMQLSYSPVELVQNGEIFEGAGPLLSLMGLIDSEITQKAPGTTTKLTIGVQTECAESDLIVMFGAALGADVANFVITNVATGVVVVPSAAAIVGGNIELTGTYISGQTYNVKGAVPSVWLGNLIQGYDAEDNGVDILIP